MLELSSYHLQGTGLYSLIFTTFIFLLFQGAYHSNQRRFAIIAGFSSTVCLRNPRTDGGL